jgi:hypothetical protein
MNLRAFGKLVGKCANHSLDIKYNKSYNILVGFKGFVQLAFICNKFNSFVLF